VFRILLIFWLLFWAKRKEIALIFLLYLLFVVAVASLCFALLTVFYE